ncbi:MAG: prefoldin subunit beta, partial [Methanomicrobiales archaeon]|nr:prefoldin subunit beta [Methanomicrobiales archaeon]
MENISPKVQNQLAMLQQLQQQLQTVAAQKAQYEMAIRESRRAIEELKDLPEDVEVFSNVGTVMVQQKKEKVLAGLTEKVESLELRVKSLEKQEKAMQARFEQLSNQIKGVLEGGKKAIPEAD